MTTCSETEQLPSSSKYKGSGASRTQRPQRNVADFHQIYQLDSRRIYSFCLRTVGNRAEAETLMHEAFLSLFRRLEMYQGDATLATLLYRFVIAEIRTRLRHDQPQRDSSLWTVTSQHGQNCDTHPVTRAPDSVSTTFAPWRLARAIVKLPLDLRIVFALHDVLGYEHAEVAEILEFSADTSRSQSHEPRLRVRDVLFPALRTPNELLPTKEGRDIS